MGEKERIELSFRIDGKPCARRNWPVVPRKDEIVYLNDPARDPASQYAARVLQVRYYDVEEIRRWGWVRVDVDVEWIND